ncbi:hypothetical protein CKM354_000713500 [Cercospora kikuchii]|uniref:Uncharacterized protein n=1 Tax=Cercospora kikuchii TaxID=84275 RepID=A0A9P3CKM0_9PEZI|nr:uncharacterized protein CKM354_000713500 [Cercospora kikuchii]GIZ43926.1 hypothetical protein CKM354_000713500 [Cercospora kikuchii]
MTMAYPRPSPAFSRPSYMDNLYKDTSYKDVPNTPPASLHSYKSSISTTSTASNYSLRSTYQATRPLSPPIEESSSDNISIRSKKSFLSPKRKFRFGGFLQRNRHTYPQTAEQPEPVPVPIAKPVHELAPGSPTTPPASAPTSPCTESPVVPVQHRPSLPKLQTNFSPASFGPPEAIDTYEKKALPALPPASKSPSRQPARTLSQSRPSMRRQKSAAELNSQGAERGCHKCYYFAARNCNGYVLGGDPGDACETCLAAGFFGAK